VRVLRVSSRDVGVAHHQRYVLIDSNPEAIRVTDPAEVGGANLRRRGPTRALSAFHDSPTTSSAADAGPHRAASPSPPDGQARAARVDATRDRGAGCAGPKRALAWTRSARGPASSDLTVRGRT
jgi:hypothetical protein